MSDPSETEEWETFTLFSDPGSETFVDFDLRLSGSGATEPRTMAPGYDPERPWYIVGHYVLGCTWVVFSDVTSGAALQAGGYMPPSAAGQSILVRGPLLRASFDASTLLFVNLARRRRTAGGRQDQRC